MNIILSLSWDGEWFAEIGYLRKLHETVGSGTVSSVLLECSKWIEVFDPKASALLYGNAYTISNLAARYNAAKLVVYTEESIVLMGYPAPRNYKKYDKGPSYRIYDWDIVSI